MMIVAIWGAGVVGFVLGCAWSGRRVGRLEADLRLLGSALVWRERRPGPLTLEQFLQRLQDRG
jgi:hypothetical protein